ncbi:hypothetical protein ACHWQZ_G003655 [Mnemiopsis leidyi]
MNGSGQSTPWFPDYDPEVEENRGRKWCNWIMMWWLLALVIGSIVCGLFVMRPGVVFQSYEPGQCTLNTLKFDEMKRCSCGKNCQSEYPCYKMTGGFVSNVTKDASTAMSLYNGFWDYDKGCVYTTCGRAESNNIDTIYEKILEFYQAHGYDDSAYNTAGGYPGLYTGAPQGTPVVAQTYSKAWFPGYNASVEENRTRKCCNFFLLFPMGFLAVAAICVGVFVIRPGVEFQNFEAGQCSLKQLTYKETKDCSCGKNCQSSFPCYKLSGVFTPNISGSANDMHISKSFWDYDKGCMWSTCSHSWDKNVAEIYNSAVIFYKEHGYDYSNLKTGMSDQTPGHIADTLEESIKVACYGDNEGAAIIQYINSAVWIGCGTIPFILLLISIIVFFVCITPGMRLSVSRWLCLPCCFIKNSKETTTYLCGPCR